LVTGVQTCALPISKKKPLRAVFRDSSYGSDSVKINVEQIFKLLSPGTELKTL
jgi:adenine-specific DNA-methyltransferase